MAQKPEPRKFSTKRCKDCYADIPLNATKCTACGRKVGEVDSQGYARRPIDWKAYFMALVGVSAFSWYIWWAFIR